MDRPGRSIQGAQTRGGHCPGTREQSNGAAQAKLLIHNGGHAICDFFGYHRGHQFIHEAVADPFVLDHVVRALNEIGNVVRRRHGFSAESINEYKADLRRRGACGTKGPDPASRARSDPQTLAARAADCPGAHRRRLPIASRTDRQGIVAALKYSHPHDAQSLQLAADIRNRGLQATLEDVCGLAKDSTLMSEITDEFRQWRHPVAATRSTS